MRKMICIPEETLDLLLKDATGTAKEELARCRSEADAATAAISIIALMSMTHMRQDEVVMEAGVFLGESGLLRKDSPLTWPYMLPGRSGSN